MSTGDANRLGLLARGSAQQSSHGQVEPFLILPGPIPGPIPISRLTTAAIGRPAGSTDPHPGELERYADALL